MLSDLYSFLYVILSNLDNESLGLNLVCIRLPNN